VERVYVEESIFTEFSKLVADGASRMKLGWSQTWDIDMGSLINAAHAEKVMGHVEGAIVAGARVLAGGHRREDLGPCFVEPTVLTQVDHSVPLATQETFGPVVSLYPVRDADEAVARANDSEYGLNASVWAGHSSPAMQVAHRIEAGSVAINSALLVYHTFDVPMGGIKQSGIGRRHGEHGILRYTQAQSIVTSFAALGGYDSVLTKVGSQKRADRFLQAARWWRRIPGIR
jgi:succinate-semialdehyde dehydrogenase/glutarate-semialdehyde dehydrogenase